MARPMTTETHYLVRWADPKEGRWRTTTCGEPTEAEAFAQFAADVAYFYDDIEIQLVRVELTVLQEARGANKRPKTIAEICSA